MLKIQFLSGISAQPMEMVANSQGNILAGFYYQDENGEWVIAPLHIVETMTRLGENPVGYYDPVYLAIPDEEEDSDEPIIGSRVLSIEYVKGESI